MSAPAISPFVWADYFETGFEDVDGQHHKLVDFINALAGRAISGVPIRPDGCSGSATARRTRLCDAQTARGIGPGHRAFRRLAVDLA